MRRAAASHPLGVEPAQPDDHLARLGLRVGAGGHVGELVGQRRSGPYSSASGTPR